MKMKTRVQRIKKWLKVKHPSSCPFFGGERKLSQRTIRAHCKFCSGLFGHNIILCPCGEFGVEYVTEKATEFVEAWDKLHEICPILYEELWKENK